jgi:type IX secretion system PorP/SprF family membrane protein
MKKIYSILFIAFLASSVFAQQQPLYSQYMFNKFLLNPAITGDVDYIPIRLTARQQWMGIENAPSTQAISAHTLLSNKSMGVGGYIFADRFGPETKIGIQASYSYILPLNAWNSKLALGIALKAFQYKLDYSMMTSIDENDQVLYKNSETAFVPDADFGAYLSGEKYFVGLSATQLIELPIKIAEKEIDKNSMIRHYYLLGGYKFKLGEKFELEPSVMAKGTEKTPFNFDINLRGIYLQNYWFGVSYRSSKDIIAMIGVKYNGFVFGYAFDYTTSIIKNYQSGSHEIMIGYNLGEGKNKGSSLL